MLRPKLTLGFLLLAALFSTTSASSHKPNCGDCVTKNSGCLSYCRGSPNCSTFCDCQMANTDKFCREKCGYNCEGNPPDIGAS